MEIWYNLHHIWIGISIQYYIIFYSVWNWEICVFVFLYRNSIILPEKCDLENVTSCVMVVGVGYGYDVMVCVFCMYFCFNQWSNISLHKQYQNTHVNNNNKNNIITGPPIPSN